MQTNGLVDLNDIPDLAHAWVSSIPQVASVRRPSTLPSPHSYHEVVEPQAIFELDEKGADGSIETILVVPFACTACKSQKQACSRARPTCARCRKSEATCVVVQEGYQMLPAPKVARPSTAKNQSASGAGEKKKVSSAPDPTARRRKASRVASLPQAPPSNIGPSISSGSKRPLSPGSEPLPPRKKTHAKRKRKHRFPTMASEETDTDYSEVSAVGPSAQVASVVAAASERSALKWTFVNKSRGRDEKSSPAQKDVNAAPSNTPIPRVWTNSLRGLLTVFPQLAGTPVGLSWFQTETPVLLLHTNHSQDRWINSTTLSIDLLWDFSCHEFELESAESGTGGSTQLHSCQPVVHSAESTLDFETDTMGLRHSCLLPRIRLSPTPVAVSVPQPMLSERILPSDDAPPRERDTYQSTSEHHAREKSLIRDTTLDDSVSTPHSAQLSPPHPLSPPESPPPHSVFNGSLAHTTIQSSIQPRIPLNKPPEVETLLDSQLRFIPLLLWIPHDSGLVPCNIPPEYAYLCMGFFLISDLRHVVVEHDVSSTTRVTQGRVCWSLTLQWAPGGEGALFDCDPAPLSEMPSDSAPLDTTKDLLHPWWFNSTDALSQADDTTPSRPRDLRMQFFSFLPLDLLADFHPSESFPRGWLCKSCGMINIQEFFRHQICQSTTCGPTREKRVLQGKVDSLSSLRNIYQSSSLFRPMNKIPSVVVSECIIWDDGMQSWIYSVKDGVFLCHVFTGNQEQLQEDATALLERIQCELLLRKEDPSGPYFFHTTRFSHQGDGSEARVPVGTPDCVRIAYYALCDFVHRYGEMDKPRFGDVRMLAWVNSGSRKGGMLCASKSPLVMHCLGAEVILKFTPKGGYKDAAEPTAPDKGKGRAEDDGRMGSPPPESRAGPSRYLERTKGKGRAEDDGRMGSPPPESRAGPSRHLEQTAPEKGEGCAKDEDWIGPPSAEPHAGPSRHLEQDGGNQGSFAPGPEANESPIATAAMDTAHQCRSLDVGGTPDSKTFHIGPGMEIHHEVVEPKEGRGRKKNKVTKDKSKTSVPEISMTLVHGDCVVLYGDNFECEIVRIGTTILVIGFPEEK